MTMNTISRFSRNVCIFKKSGFNIEETQCNNIIKQCKKWLIWRCSKKKKENGKTIIQIGHKVLIINAD